MTIFQSTEARPVPEIPRVTSPRLADGGSELPTLDDLVVNIVAYREGVPTDIPWIVKPLAYAGGVALIAGPPKAGKSTLAAQIQRCRESGELLFGAWPVSVGPTLLVTEEGGVPVLYKTEGLLQLDVLDRRAALLNGCDFSGVLRVAREWSDRNPGGVAFIDTLAIWAGIEDENDASQTTRAISLVTDLAQTTNLAVILIHHARKSGGESGEAIRGSGAILATVDIGIELSRVDPMSDDRWLDVMGRVGFQERFRLEFDRSTMSYNIADFASDLDEVPYDGPGLTMEDLARVWQESPKRRVEALLQKGLLRREKVKHGRGWPYHYWRVDVLTDSRLLVFGGCARVTDAEPTGALTVDRRSLAPVAPGERRPLPLLHETGARVGKSGKSGPDSGLDTPVETDYPASAYDPEEEPE